MSTGMKLSQIFESRDTSDVTPLYPITGLFLKPMSRINITIHFPLLKQSIPTGGTNVSSWGIMEKLKALVSPDHFISIKTVKNTLEFIRFEGDVENRTVLKGLIGRLDGKSMKVTGIKDPLKILVSETKLQFPTKYDWDSFFRDAHYMNEMKPGERPDTVHFKNLPIDWFVVPKSSSEKHLEASTRVKDTSGIDKASLPSEKIFRRIWEGFGDIRALDIPMLDPYRNKIKPSLAGIKTFNFNHDRVFEAYVQYKEYLGFVKSMDALRGSLLAHKEDEKFFVTQIKVDFDKTKHLSEDSMKQRSLEIEKVREKDATERQRSKLGKVLQKATKNEKGSSGIKETKGVEVEAIEIDRKIAMEERKYLVARRKLEAIRLMDFLFERLKAKLLLKKEQIKKKRRKKELKRTAAAATGEDSTGKKIKNAKASEIRERLLNSMAARRAGDTRRKEMVAKSVKKAIQDSHLRKAHFSASTNHSRSYFPRHVYPHRETYEERDYDDDMESDFESTVVPVYGSHTADRAYEKYFKSISRR